jgi:hypothetical protein
MGLTMARHITLAWDEILGPSIKSVQEATTDDRGRIQEVFFALPRFYFFNPNVGRVVNTTASYSGCPELKSRPRDRLS